MKKNRSKDEEKHTKHTKKEEIVDSRSKEEKERDRVELWKLEIERKINLEAQEKGIKLTKEQLEKVRDRRLKKLTKKMAEKKQKKEGKTLNELPVNEKVNEEKDKNDKGVDNNPKSSQSTFPPKQTTVQSPCTSPPHQTVPSLPTTPIAIQTASPPKKSENTPKTPKSSQVEPKKEKISPVVLPKLDGILTPKREKKESNENVLSPDDPDKNKCKLIFFHRPIQSNLYLHSVKKRKTEDKEHKEVKKLKIIKDINFLGEQNQDLVRFYPPLHKIESIFRQKCKRRKRTMPIRNDEFEKRKKKKQRKSNA